MAHSDQRTTTFNISVPDEYLARIGKISVAWGTLESVVDLALAKLGGFRMQDPRGAIVTAHMTWPLKMDILESLVNALADEHPRLKQYSKVKPLLKRAQEGRNSVSHGSWGYEDGKAYKARATARGRLKASVDPITLGMLDSIVNDIGSAGRAVLDVIFDTGKCSGAVITDDI
jgi:hypothetical protein